MTEESHDLVPRKLSLKKKEPAKKREDDLYQKLQLMKDVTDITPDLDPQEAMRRFKLVEEAYYGNEDKMLKLARAEMLRREGLNPSDWTLFPRVVHPKDLKVGFTVEDMEREFGNLPTSLEVTVFQGYPAVTDPIDIRLQGEPNYSMHERFWTAFVRARSVRGHLETAE